MSRSSTARRALSIATAAAMGVTGISVATFAGAGAAAAADASSIAWSACTDANLVTVGAQCGFVPVPMDWSKPTGKKIEVAVSRVRATVPAAQRQGVMLINPGGPGGSGLLFPAILPGAVPKNVGRKYDWVGFDPRGVGSSRPALSCDPNYFDAPRPAYMPSDPTKILGNEATWVTRSKGYAAACAKRNGAMLAHVKTVDTVRDMDAIRAALGEKQLNYYGFSYGTFLGQVYSTMFPDRMRRMVLDGNVPPTYPGYGDGGRGQMIGFEKVIQKFFGWVAAHHTVYGLGTSAKEVEKAFYTRQAALDRTPVSGIGGSEWNDAFLLAGYAESRWPAVAAAWAEWEGGNVNPINRLYNATATPGDDNGYAAFNATLCTDGPFPRDYGKVRSDAFSIAKDAPFLTWGGFWFSMPCTFWPVKPGRPAQVDGSKAKSVLLINATLDGATPFAGALAVRQEFPAASLVAEDGATTHAGSLRGNKCVDNAVAAYLDTGAEPARLPGTKADLTCAALPQPEPSPLDRSQPASTSQGVMAPGDLVAALLDNLRSTTYGNGMGS
jgi:pimeloyl-ACP methyl ester carboxylesterase